MNAPKLPTVFGQVEPTTMQHTPGPWVCDNTDPLQFGVRIRTGMEPIGFVYSPSFPERSEYGRRALANAQMAAAAPAMADALDLIICCLQDEIDEGRRLPQLIMKELIKKANAALPTIAPDESTQAPPEALDDRRN